MKKIKKWRENQVKIKIINKLIKMLIVFEKNCFKKNTIKIVLKNLPNVRLWSWHLLQPMGWLLFTFSDISRRVIATHTKARSNAETVVAVQPENIPQFNSAYTQRNSCFVFSLISDTCSWEVFLFSPTLKFIRLCLPVIFFPLLLTVFIEF